MLYECKIYKPNPAGELVHASTITSAELQRTYWEKVQAPKIGRKSVTGPKPKTRLIKCRWCKKDVYVASPKAFCCPGTNCINKWRWKHCPR